jgi:hypothetical protein
METNVVGDMFALMDPSVFISAKGNVGSKAMRCIPKITTDPPTVLQLHV